MGIFSNLFKSNKKANRKIDRVYLTRKAANKAIIQLAVEAAIAKRHLIIIYFFKETKQEFEREVTNATNVNWANALFPQQIKQAGFGGLDHTDIIVAETHPDLNTEETVLNTIAEMGYTKAPVMFINGLDDPIFIPFGAERMQKLMVTMGIKEDEPIEHKMITASMERAQKKVTAKNLNIGRIDSRAEMIRQLTI